MAKRKRRKTGEVVEALVVINGTTKFRRFWAASASVQEWDDGRALIELVDGCDAKGPVSMAHYRQAEEIIRRPARGKRS